MQVHWKNKFSAAIVRCQHLLNTEGENIPEETLRWENYFAVENIQLIDEGELVNRSVIGTTRVLYNHHLFTKSGFWSWRIKSIFLRTESRHTARNI